MEFSKKQMRDIGLEYYLSSVNTTTPFGEKRKRNLYWYDESKKNELIEEWTNIDYFKEKLLNEREKLDSILNLFCLYRDITPSLKYDAKTHTFDEVVLFEIKQFAILTKKLIYHYREICHDFHSLEFCDLDKLIALLDPEKEGLETFYIYNAYSKKLAHLRDQKYQLEKKLKNTSDNNLKTELLRERRSLVDDIDEEEFKLRKELTAKVLNYKDDLLKNSENIAKLDHWLAKAKAHIEFQAIKPIFSTEKKLKFIKMENPYFKKLIIENGGKYQAVDLAIGLGTTLLSGANMGGKTVTLKTLYLNTLLVHLGYYPIAESAEISLLSFISFIGYESQDVKRGLSSFASEFYKIKDVMAQAKKEHGLIIMDEPACGTNPTEGTAIVRGLARKFNQGENFFIMSSHFDDVVEKGMTHYQIKGISQLADEKLKILSLEDGNYVERIQSLMDYSIILVDQEKKIPAEAVKIIELLGLDEQFIDDVKRLLRGENEQIKSQLRSGN